MNDNKFNEHLEHLKRLDVQAENLQKKEHDFLLNKPINDQNERFYKLWKGYRALGLLAQKENEPFTLLIRASFLSEFEKIEMQHKFALSQISDIENNKFKVQEETEKYISNLFTLTSDRWNTICAYDELWRKERTQIRNNELSESNFQINEQQFTQMLNRYEQLLLVGEEQLKELETIFELREKLYAQAVKLFEM